MPHWSPRSPIATRARPILSRPSTARTACPQATRFLRIDLQRAQHLDPITIRYRIGRLRATTEHCKTKSRLAQVRYQPEQSRALYAVKHGAAGTHLEADEDLSGGIRVSQLDSHPYITASRRPDGRAGRMHPPWFSRSPQIAAPALAQACGSILRTASRTLPCSFVRPSRRTTNDHRDGRTVHRPARYRYVRNPASGCGW